MGQTLSEPLTEKKTTEARGERLAYGASSMQGWRIGMEDAHTTLLNLLSAAKKKQLGGTAAAAATSGGVAFFSVFDGHGGAGTAQFCGARLHEKLASMPRFEAGEYEFALRSAFLAMDEELLADPSKMTDSSGCTAVVVLVTEDGRVICANAGDSRAVLCAGGEAFALSHDHKPDSPEELARIRAAGGFVEWNRVNGNLALSRAIGDFEFKKSADLPPEAQIVTANPDIIVRKVQATDEFFVVACDGIWDCLTSQRVMDYVSLKIAAGTPLGVICEELMMYCLAPTSNMNGFGCDNMTVMVVALYQGRTHDEWVGAVRGRVDAHPPEPFAPKELGSGGAPGGTAAHGAGGGGGGGGEHA